MTRYDIARARWRLSIFSRKKTTSNARDGVDSPVFSERRTGWWRRPADAKRTGAQARHHPPLARGRSKVRGEIEVEAASIGAESVLKDSRSAG